MEPNRSTLELFRQLFQTEVEMLETEKEARTLQRQMAKHDREATLRLKKQARDAHRQELRLLSMMMIDESEVINYN